VRNFIFSLALLIAAFTLSGCDEVAVIDSDVLATGNIYVDMHVTSSGDGQAVVEVQLNKDSSNGVDVRLAGEDKLIASTQTISEKAGGSLFDSLKTVSESTKVLSEGSKKITTAWGDLDIGGPWYIASFSGINSGTTFYINLDRDFDGGAKNSEVTLPSQVVITSPSATDGFSRSADGIPVSWVVSDAQYAMSVSAKALCENDMFAEWDVDFADDPGTTTIPANTFGHLLGNCSVRILVERSKQGSLNPRFAGGQVRGHTQDKVIVYTSD
jgi:hypothetical protein